MSAAIERMFDRWVQEASVVVPGGANASSVSVMSHDAARLAEKIALATPKEAALSPTSVEGTIVHALRALGDAEKLRMEKKYVESIEGYGRALARNAEAWMNAGDELSALVASQCGLVTTTSSSSSSSVDEKSKSSSSSSPSNAVSHAGKRGRTCSVAAYRACSATALSGRALSKMALGSWSEAIRDCEAAIDAAPDYALVHERFAEVLTATEAAGDLARAYADNARALRELLDETAQTSAAAGMKRPASFEGDSADESSVALATSRALAKTMAAGEWVHARRMALYGGGVMFASTDSDDVERMYEDRVLFLERAKVIFMRKYAEIRAATATSSASAKTTVDANLASWLDNAFALAGFDDMSAYERANVCLSIGNIFSWVGDFSGAAELFSCGIQVVVNSQDDSAALDELEPILEHNRALCQLRAGNFAKAQKNVRKLMRGEKCKEFACGFLRIAEVACVREEWDMAEQSYRIASRFGAELQVRHKIVLTQRAALENKPALVDVEQLEELDKIQDGKEAEFAETPRFANGGEAASAFSKPPSFRKQNSLTDVDDDPLLFAEATQELLDELENGDGCGTPDSQSSAEASKLFSGGGARSLKLSDVMADLAGASSPRRGLRKRKARDEACSCAEMFNYFGWGSMDASEARANSVEDEVFLATLLTDVDDDAMQVDAQMDAETSK